MKVVSVVAYFGLAWAAACIVTAAFWCRAFAILRAKEASSEAGVFTRRARLLRSETGGGVVVGAEEQPLSRD